MEETKDSVVAWSIGMLSNKKDLKQNPMLGKTIKKMININKMISSATGLNFKKEFNRKPTTLKNIIATIAKKKNERTRYDIKTVSQYLVDKYDYFKQLQKESDVEKLESLVSVLNLEVFHTGDHIISYGEEGTKFYIVLEGNVGVYKPKFVETLMTVKEFVVYLNVIKYEERNEIKLKRVEDQNAGIYDIGIIKLFNYEANRILDSSLKRNFYVEEEVKIGDGGDGMTFGEIALIQNQKRNATIIALSHSSLATIDKSDYIKIIRELEAKRFNEMIDSYKKNFFLLKTWTKSSIIQLLSYCSKVTLHQGEYLYEQNQVSDSIYFIVNGCFELYSYTSIGTFEAYINYIHSGKGNMVSFLLSRAGEQSKEKDFEDYIKQADEISGPSPFITPGDVRHSKKFTLSNIKEKLVDIKIREEELKDPLKLLKIKIRAVDFKDTLGLEDALELKRRYYSIKCTSSTAELKKISLINFMNIISLTEVNKPQVQSVLLDKKELLIKQLKNFMTIKLMNLNRMLSMEYSRILNKDENFKSEPDGPRIKRFTITGMLSGNAEQNPNDINANKNSSTAERQNGSGSYQIRIIPVASAEDQIVTHIHTSVSDSLGTGDKSLYVKNNNNNNNNVSPIKNRVSGFLEQMQHSRSKSEKTDVKEYRKYLELKNYENLTYEISKLTGRNIIKKRRNISLRLPSHVDQKLIEINSVNYLNTRDHTSTNLEDNDIKKTVPSHTRNHTDGLSPMGIGIKSNSKTVIYIKQHKNSANSKVTNIWRKDGIPMEIKMKYFKMLRKKKKLNNFLI